MTFGWESYFLLAQRLAGDPEEACQRSAISRAYYAAFHKACAYVKKAHPEVPFRGHGVDHDLVWKSLKTCSSKQEIAVGHHGDRLRQLRAKADYKLVGLSLPQETRQALQQAEAIIQMLGRMSGPH